MHFGKLCLSGKEQSRCFAFVGESSVLGEKQWLASAAVVAQRSKEKIWEGNLAKVASLSDRDEGAPFADMLPPDILRLRTPFRMMYSP
jgi:hypothetical protein